MPRAVRDRELELCVVPVIGRPEPVPDDVGLGLVGVRRIDLERAAVPLRRIGNIGVDGPDNGNGARGRLGTIELRDGKHGLAGCKELDVGLDVNVHHVTVARVRRALRHLDCSHRRRPEVHGVRVVRRVRGGLTP